MVRSWITSRSSYRVSLTPAAQRVLRRLDRPVQRRPMDALGALGTDPGSDMQPYSEWRHGQLVGSDLR